MWADLGLDERLLDQPTATLSGGEAARAGLAALILSRYDVYLLDEPTNDLDLDGLRPPRAVGHRARRPASCSSATTGRSWPRTVTDVVELDEFTHRATEYGGGWQAYLDEREAARRHAWERYEAYDTERRALAGRAQREREWASQGLARVRRDDEPDKFIRALQDRPDRAARRAGGAHRAGDRAARRRRQAARAVAS